MSTYYGDPRQCLERIVKSASARFNESVDVAVNLSSSFVRSDQQIKGVVTLPYGTGKDIRVAVFVQDDYLSEGEEAGAEIVGNENLVEEIKNGRKLDVDWCITTPDFISKIIPIAKVLGSKGLMPNPKFGTVTSRVAETVRIIKSGQVKFKADKTGVIHGKLGTIKFSVDDLLENLKAFLTVVKSSNNHHAKEICFKSVFLSSTMGRAYKIHKIENII